MSSSLLAWIVVETDELIEVHSDKFSVKRLRGVFFHLAQLLVNLGKPLGFLLFVLVLFLLGFVAPFEFRRGFTEVYHEKTVDFGEGLVFLRTKLFNTRALFGRCQQPIGTGP